MGVLWLITIPFVIVLAVITIVDVFRHKHGAGAIAGWVLIVIVFPVVGAIVYWATRKPTDADVEVEQAYRAEADRRSQRLPTDRGAF
jgi:hypothetical protein